MKLICNIAVFIFFCINIGLTQSIDEYWINYFKAVSIDKNETKFKQGVRQLGIFYLNPEIEYIELVEDDSLYIRGRLLNENINFSTVIIFLLQKYEYISLPSFRKKERYRLNKKINDVDSEGVFELHLNYKKEALLFLCEDSKMDHIGLLISEKRN